MMKILKASAGSGKTYRLTQTYLDYLFRSGRQDAYRHILAVTFTNKATEEMKSRILKELHSRSADDPKAREMLVSILHDYSAFAISTIDKFFQQTLKAFSREIGQFADYQVELDKKSLIHESIDRILDSLTEDQTELIKWMDSIVMGQLGGGKRFNLEKDLYEAAERLKSTEFTSLCEKYGIDPRTVFSKENLAGVREACESALGDPDTAVAGTAAILKEQTYSLGIVSEFYKAFEELLREKNVMVLDDSNKILKDIIDGSDAPFVYEKLGVRFENFLLDEFQDTSTVQWGNFLPLIRESEAGGHDNLVVGDVKQSIYRWRGSDWKLLASEIAGQFRDADVESMKDNWRSLPAVVNFNNAFFTYAAGEIDRTLGLQNDALNVSHIYEDVAQQVRTADTQPGYVEVSMVEKGTKEIKVLESVRRAMSAGARAGDIAVLVRTNAIGGKVASYLISNGVPVISDDSLSTKSSIIVRRLVSLLSAVESPGDTVGAYLASELGVIVPDSYHSLVDLCEDLLRKLECNSPELFHGEIPYVMSFMDILQDWTRANGNNLMLFLKYWDGLNPTISSPQDSAAVRIITIHKAKGLEYPYVIIPYAESTSLYKSDVHWSHPDLDGTGLGGVADGIYPISLKQGTEKTLFCRDYLEEKKMQAVDNINVFYVAATRAVKCLHIIATEPTAKTFHDKVDKGKPYAFKNFAEILYAFCRDRGYVFGSMYDFSGLERKDDGRADFPAAYPSIPLGERLRASEDASDFFGEDGSTGVDASQRLAGIELHGILSGVNCISDFDGMTGPDAALLRERAAAHPEWFPADASSAVGGAQYLNEVSIIATDGSVYRPDRVIMSGEGDVTVIDYKFGEERKKYERQVASYADLYRAMGYGRVSAYLWYVYDDKVVKVR